jgi:hypothetical protein
MLTTSRKSWDCTHHACTWFTDVPNARAMLNSTEPAMLSTPEDIITGMSFGDRYSGELSTFLKIELSFRVDDYHWLSHEVIC